MPGKETGILISTGAMKDTVRGSCSILSSTTADNTGPVFRYGPNRLSFNTHTALNAIYSVKANVRKADFYHMLTSPDRKSTV